MKNELAKILSCPACYSSKGLEVDGSRLLCGQCSSVYEITNGVPILLDPKKSADLFQNYQVNKGKDWHLLDQHSIGIEFSRKPFHTRFKRLNKWLNFIKYPYVPVWQPPTFQNLHDHYSSGGRVLHLGGGTTSPDLKGWVNADILPYKSVDVVGDGRCLPFPDQSFDLIVSNSMLEHIAEYQTVISECYRVLKPGGYIWMCVPQVCGRHHTYDYWRWTLPGLKKVMGQFEIVNEGARIGTGPFLAILMEATLEAALPRPSFFKELARTVVLWIAFPIRFIDRIAAGSDMFHHFAHTIYVTGRKRKEGQS
jgi:SAM-dependent methyltransferase